ncbi:MAG: LysM peptidoglycan-binding domain-containing protein [Phycisphaerae bacterium]|nr:LysM peptidoglycan-binding domain-containing protein [Phycisphaerae bacterium]
MTREHKLALILGFSLVLGVFVLLSDHFSSARRDKTGDDLPLPIEATKAELTPTRPIPAMPGMDASEPRTGHANQLASDGKKPVTSKPGTEIVSGQRPSLSGVDGVDANGKLIPRSNPTPSSTDGKSTDPLGTAPPAGATPAASYTVQKGDTLEKIAEKLYGSGSQWKKLADANASRIGDNHSIRVGATLVVPSLEVAKPVMPRPEPKTTVKPDGPKATGASPQDGSKRPELKKPTGVSYTVQKGDTLSKIAARALGSANRWSEILSLNSSKLSDESDLQVGMVLRLPEK